MSQFTPHGARRPAGSQARRRSPTLAFAALAVLAAGAIGVAIAAAADGGGGGSGGDLAATGEINDMGVPVVETPGSGSGTAEAGGIVVDGATWALGDVPLNVAVRPTWTLRNDGDDTVTLGQAHAEVREGCCPGPATLGATTVAPGDSTTLTFELAMHPGMEGPHDLALHVPVDSTTGETSTLEVEVIGDFGN